MNSSCLEPSILERDGKVVPGLGLGEVDLHARVYVSVVSPISLHLVSDELEDLTHAILSHFLFSFLQLLELSKHTLKDYSQFFRVAPEGLSLLLEFLLRLVAVFH